MKLKKYTVSEECIGCRACVEVAENNFDMCNQNVAYIKKQPSTKEEEKISEEAMNVCPVEAISVIEVQVSGIEPVLAKSIVKEVLDEHPDLKQILIDLSPKFKRMQNPVVYNTLAKFASFKDAAKVTGVSICEILHTVNRFLGVEEKLIKNMPECISSQKDEDILEGTELNWEESAERYIYNSGSMDELFGKISELKAQQNIVILSVEKPNELLKTVKGLGFEFNLEKHREYRVSIFNPEKEEMQIPWEERKSDFEVMDVRMMQTDPFDIIIKKSYEIEEDSGFTLIQRFEPTPMINMLSEMGYEHITEQVGQQEVWIYFHKKVTDKSGSSDEVSDKVDVVIQSATPVAYPVMMRLLQSEKIRKSINIKELKVWEETEKHLAWIVNGRADISFSALITSAKLKDSDVIIPAMFVWDNFVILTRYKAKGLKDIKGKEIHTPLFEEAPPAKITKYLIKASGLNVDDYKFVYGTPFGRPEKIYADFVTGNADTVILREPEASYAIKIMQDRGEDISVISYNKIWNEINPGFGSFPNAGIILKGEFVRKNPEITKVLLEELKKAIDWVNKNRHESAKLSFDMMRQPVDRVELFLENVNFEYVEGEKLNKKVKAYFDILMEQGIVEAKIDDKFLSIFKV
ncbi:MAG: ferredoxin [Bacteroidales bacterium]|nr:ferredoxin [Bacteroidales bacterium]